MVSLCQWLCQPWLQARLFLVLVLLEMRASASTCPHVCFCPSISQIVYCPRKELEYVPSGIPPDTIQLNLNDNAFINPVISRDNFTRYTELQQLYLTGCGIEYIKKDTFKNNKKLKWLDIGKNKLKTISDYTFRDLTLDHLFLNDNPGVQISLRAFVGMKTTGLYMQNNGLEKLSLEVLRPMNASLKTLWMDGNKFERFHHEWLYLFKTLSHLRVGDNPLHCNCETEWLYEFYTATSRIFEGGAPPSCGSPKKLLDKSFKNMTADSFECMLPVIEKVDVIFDEDRGKMTCLAHGDPIPTIYWIKPNGDAVVSPPKPEDVVKDKIEGVMYVQQPRALSKSRYVCVAGNPAGNTTVSINVAWPPPPEYQTDVDQIGDEKPLSDDSKGVISAKDIKEEKDKKEPFKIEINSEIDASKVGASNMVKRKESEGTVKFTAGDIVGAVIGTFLLTLLACVLVFHVFYRHQRKNSNSQQNFVPTHKMPPSRYRLDEVELAMKMLEKKNFPADIHV